MRLSKSSKSFHESTFYQSLCEWLIAILMASFFLSVGADYSGHIQFRMLLGGGTFLFCLPFIYQSRFLKSYQILFAILFCFGGTLILRAIWAFIAHHLYQVPESDVFPYERYLKSPLRWCFYMGAFVVAAHFFNHRKSIEKLMNVLAWSGFFIALNAIPPLLTSKKFGFVDAAGEFRFFHPVFYFKEWVAKYLMSPVSHPNFVGDFIAVGGFAALALFFYSGLILSDSLKEDSIPKVISDISPLYARCGLYLLISLVCFSAVLLLFSRGTIISFFVSFLAYSLIILFRLRLFEKGKYVLGVAAIFFFFLMWAGNLNKAWREVQTVSKSMDVQDDSMQTNIEGAKRALRIFKDYPIWGVGTGGYESLSLRYASLGTSGIAYLSQFQAMNHYLHLMAEEGSAAFIYFAFILIYFVETVKRSFQTDSRFKLIVAGALITAVFMILMHAFINDLMQRFSTSMLVYLCMGVSLGIYREDAIRSKNRDAKKIE